MVPPKASKVFEVSFSDSLAIAAIALTTILVVLDKAGKLKGPILFVLLGLAFAMLVGTYKPSIISYLNWRRKRDSMKPPAGEAGTAPS
jgi:hypothetical protein